VSVQPGAGIAKGPLSARSIELVQRSWAQVMPISDAAAGLFYDRLFEMDPSVRPLFKSDMAQQKKKLMQTLAVAVDGLTNLPRLVPVLEQLGVRHAGYMVQDHHYGLVGEALLWTLREGLGDGFNQETELAWREVYGLVASVMKKAAASGAAAKPSVSPPPPTPASPPPLPEEVNFMDTPPPIAAPAVAAPFAAAHPVAAPPLPPLSQLPPPIGSQAAGDQTVPYHLLAQTRVASLPPYVQHSAHGDHPPAPQPPPAPAPATAAPAAEISIPVSVPKDVNVNLHLTLKLEADPTVAALLQRALAPEPPPRKAPQPEPTRAEPPAASKSAASPWLLAALSGLVSVSTVFALGPLGQAASSVGLSDLPRLAAPVFTLAALTVGYLWGRGRDSDRRR
jgi:hemoglobin-like flavoprotein